MSTPYLIEYHRWFENATCIARREWVFAESEEQAKRKIWIRRGDVEVQSVESHMHAFTLPEEEQLEK